MNLFLFVFKIVHDSNNYHKSHQSKHFSSQLQEKVEVAGLFFNATIWSSYKDDNV